MKITYVIGERIKGNVWYSEEHTVPYRGVKYHFMNGNVTNGSVIMIDSTLYSINNIRLLSAKSVKLWLTVHAKDGEL